MYQDLYSVSQQLSSKQWVPSIKVASYIWALIKDNHRNEYIWALIKDNNSNEYIWALINLNPLLRKALDCLFGWHIKFIKLRNKGCLGKITEFTLALNIENDRINILRWENSYFDHFWNEETDNCTVAIWRSCHHKFFLVFPFFYFLYWQI